MIRQLDAVISLAVLASLLALSASLAGSGVRPVQGQAAPDLAPGDLQSLVASAMASPSGAARQGCFAAYAGPAAQGVPLWTFDAAGTTVRVVYVCAAG
ncbi:MAG: hypothetical protein JRN39_05890 [Nitrososphaerota archaeon]|nr:hypothetical protein [Nitrososphaerota archaeon]MDG6939912.1 hypothetical protein [Nitrososphaerota archaeon]